MSRASLSRMRGWDPATVAVTADPLAAMNLRMAEAVRRVGRHVDEAVGRWRGDAAAAAALRALESRLAAGQLAAAVLDIADACADAGNLAEIRAAVLGLEDDAHAHGCVVADDGTVTAPVADTGNPALDLALQACLDTKAAALQARLVPLLAAADGLDREVAARLDDARAELLALAANPQGARPDSRVIDILDGAALFPDDPYAVHELWESLTPADRDALVAYDPAIGNRDGIPAVARDFYNRRYLARLESAAHAELAYLDGLHPDWAAGRNPPSTPAEWIRLREWDAARQEAHTRLADYRVVRRQLDGGDDPPRYLLAVDDSGRGAIALGNPDSARNIATFLPGTGARLGTIGAGVDRSRALLDAATRANPAERSAVITWYGYHAPPDLMAALRPDYATAAAPALDRFLDGLRATHSGPHAHTTLVGHSYGSTVIGVAATGGRSLAADSVIFVGSPGVRTDHVTELRLDGVPPADNPRHIFATAAAADPVAVFGSVAHGISPIERAFGATVFESAPGTRLQLPFLTVFPGEPWAHHGYWDAGNPGLVTQGEIVGGAYPR
ncbi:hypothetical protein FOH10_19580 [Nocardia otitidiscaviarum]|uniref:DUF1023 domain-containing protein n=1 Tax=Nocardia otitidiscaviarum TaxID=1823 RepID=A0A516NNV9_9NOCA|nr:alpha/beta hydrolase [Nocardia otitidiscaviarum]MCP9624176.1 alpha/beta hydrolase family protein [Nocardia otitidiscaviarum]QDP80591.1 hypothetical protein FOH10_19580 [Nocardia otitidiscaviarum]